MHQRSTHDGTILAHWLEHLSENLKRLPADARRTAYSLLHSPWKCPSHDILAYVPSPLCRSIVFLQKSVLRHVFRERSRLSLATAARDVWIDAFARGPEGALQPLEHNTVIALESYIGLAKEDLAKANIRWNEISGAARASLLALYVECEVAVHLMANMFEVANDAGRSLRYVVPARLHAARKMRWFSLYWAQQSNIADASKAMMVWHSLKQLDAPARKAGVFQAWVDTVLDKYLCLHRGYVQKLTQTKSGAVIPAVWARAELLCLVYLQSLGARMDAGDFPNVVLEDRPLASISREDLQRAGFHNAEVDALLEESAAQPPGDQLVTQADDARHLLVHNLNLKFAVQRYMGALFSRIGDPIGDWFERDYILQYLQERLEPSRHMVWSRFKDDAAKYDADIIIYDRALQVFYFCQVKHRAHVIQPYLRDELNEFGRGASINHGVDQLVRLRELIDTDKVRDRLVSKLGKKLVGTGPLSQRSRFLLVHTVENFDMCTRNGVSMYEWNTFRNLLQGRVLFSGRDVDGIARYETKELDLSNLEAVQEHLMNVAARLSGELASNQPTPKDSYALLRHAELSLQYRKALWLNDRRLGKFRARMLRVPLL